MRCQILLMLFAAGSPDSSGQPASLDVELASMPATVATTAGRTFRGLLDGYRENRLHLRIATGGGEVGYSFAREEIATFTLPGDDLASDAQQLWERGRASEALPLLQALGRQRSRYLPLLDAAQRHPLLLLVQVADVAGDPHAVIGYARLLAPHAEAPGERELLRDAELGAHVRLGLRDETRRLAEAWCRETDPAGTSALGWSLLARAALDDGDLGRARWIALQPVVFSSFQTAKHLDVCYAIAITAAHRLGDAAHVHQLRQEMADRGLPWPAGFAAPDSGAADEQASSSPESRRAAKARPLTLEDVRKLVARPAL